MGDIKKFRKIKIKTPTKQLNQKIELNSFKSFLYFFWIITDDNPKSDIISAKGIIIKQIVIRPKSFGTNNFANTILIKNFEIILNATNKNDHFKEFLTYSFFTISICCIKIKI